MGETSVITIALHTPSHSARVAKLLEKEGIEVKLSEKVLPGVSGENPVELQIKIEDIESALRIIENLEIFPLEGDEKGHRVSKKKKPKDLLLGKRVERKSSKPIVLVPVDFSEYSLMAARIAFHIAQKHKAKIVLLHAFVLPSRTDNLSLSPDLATYDPEDIELEMTLEETAKQQMTTFADKLKNEIKNGTIPAIKFDTEILEGLPETVILDFSRENEPLLIVMGTRGADKKERELIGSVTAEVLDNCRYPAFTIPETTAPLVLPKEIKEVIFFCNLDKEDIDAMNTLHRIFPDCHFHITLIHIPMRRERFLPSPEIESTSRLADYFKIKYNGYTFESRDLSAEEVKQMLTGEDLSGVQFIVIPNKRRNALVRLFNPSLAHRLLFHADIPMMVIPV
ncbi:MAG: universal stress protein [Muribaculaceae bacterium]|nr:universal stress protein [Muribaculaceae bacterium]